MAEDSSRGRASSFYTIADLAVRWDAACRWLCVCLEEMAIACVIYHTAEWLFHFEFWLLMMIVECCLLQWLMAADFCHYSALNLIYNSVRNG